MLVDCLGCGDVLFSLLQEFTASMKSGYPFVSYTNVNTMKSAVVAPSNAKAHDGVSFRVVRQSPFCLETLCESLGLFLLHWLLVACFIASFRSFSVKLLNCVASFKPIFQELTESERIAKDAMPLQVISKITAYLKQVAKAKLKV